MSSLCAVQSDLRALLEAAVGTPTQRLIAILEAAGITATAELAKLIGIGKRAVKLARQEMRGGITLPPVKQDSQGRESRFPQEGNQASPSRPRVEGYNKPIYQEPTVYKEDSTPFIPLHKSRAEKSEKGADAGDRVAMRDGKLWLCPALRSFWIGQFGDDESEVELALLQAAGWVQPNSSRPLEAQVSAQLARYARERRERGLRYAARARQPAPVPRRSALDILHEMVAREARDAS